MTTLPAVAEHKLRALEAAALDAQALAQASKVAIDRLNVDVGNLTTRQTFHAGNSDKAQASAVAADLAKVTAALDAAQAEHFERQARAQACARTLTQVRAWLRGLRPDAVLEPVEPEPVKMPPGESAAAALTRVRSTVLDLAHERENVARAAPTQGELREAVARHVAELAEQARPSLDVTGGLRVNWNMRALPHQFFAWLAPDVLADMLLHALGDDAGGDMTAEQRAARLAEIKGALDQAERQEEALVVMCIAAGVAVDRRPDASPAAVLGVRTVRTVKAAKAKVAA